MTTTLVAVKIVVLTLSGEPAAVKIGKLHPLQYMNYFD